MPIVVHHICQVYFIKVVLDKNQKPDFSFDLSGFLMLLNLFKISEKTNS